MSLNMTTMDNLGYDEDEIPSSPDLEPVSAELRKKVAVRIRNLRKTYYSRGKEPVKAVDGTQGIIFSV